MLITAEFLIEGNSNVVRWDHATPFTCVLLNAAEGSTVELVGIRVPNDPYFSHTATPSLPWDLHIGIPPKVRFVLDQPRNTFFYPPILVDRNQEVIYNHGDAHVILELRGNFQNHTHYITPVCSGPDLVFLRHSDRPLQDSFSVGLLPDPEPPAPTLWDHLDES